ncbi:MAG: glycosyltransferase family 25 protein [Chitinophagaceae bacterium]
MNDSKLSSNHTAKQYYPYLNEYYDKIYVLTIQRATERQEKVKNNLDGLDFEFFYGTDKIDWSKEKFIEKGIYNEKLAVKMHRYGKKMSLGEVAAALSHKQLYEDIIKNNYQKVLIFEDDVIPNFSKLHLIPEILKELPNDWELLYWGYLTKYAKRNLLTFIRTYIYHVQHALGFLKWNHTMIRNMQPVQQSGHISSSGFHDMIHAYAITNSAAEKLLRWNTPIQYCADTGISYAILTEQIKSYITHPEIFHQEQQLHPHSYKSLIKH